MKFFVDSADVAAIKELNDLGMVDGVTTNPSLILKSGRDIVEVTKEICDMVSGPVSAEVVATEAKAMIAERPRRAVPNGWRRRTTWCAMTPAWKAWRPRSMNCTGNTRPWRRPNLKRPVEILLQMAQNSGIFPAPTETDAA